MTEATTGRGFGMALCQHFGLKLVLDVKVNNEPDEIFGATIRLALTPEDVEAIGRLMAQPASTGGRGEG